MAKLTKEYADNKHVNINISSATPWYKQLNSKCELESGNFLYDSTRMYIYSKSQKADLLQQKSCLHLENDCKLKFTDLDFDTYDYYIKFYKVIENWNENGNRNGPRLVYSIIGDCINNHTYTHPQAVKIDPVTSIATLSSGFYGYRGWEIVRIYKNAADLNTYRINNEAYLGIDLIDTDIKHFETNSVQVIKNAEFDNFKEYAIPYFNIRNNPIVGVGYYGKAIREHSNDEPRFISEKSINPFGSSKTDKWNFYSPKLIYNGGSNIIANNSIEISRDKTNKTITINGQVFNYDDRDHIVIYVRKPGTPEINTSIPYNLTRYTNLAYLDDSRINSGLTCNIDTVSTQNSKTYLLAKSFSSTNTLSFKNNNLEIFEMIDDYDYLNSYDFISQYTRKIQDTEYIYNLYKKIVKTSTWNITFELKQPDSDNKVYKTYGTTVWEDMWAAICKNFGYDHYFGSSSTSSKWEGTYTLNLTVKNMPYIGSQNNRFNVGDVVINIGSELATDSNIEYMAPIMKLYKTIGTNTTAGIINSNIYGIKGEKLVTTNGVNLPGRADTFNKNIQIGLKGDSLTKNNVAIWVVLWRY